MSFRYQQMLIGVLKVALDALTSVLFPAPCRICGQSSYQRQPHSGMRGLPGARLRRSSSRCANAADGRLLLRWLAQAQAASLPICAGRTFIAFDRARSFAIYNDALFEAIMLMKYEEVTRLGRLVRGAACGCVA